MNLLEAFATIFTGIWTFITMPAMMAFYAVLLMATGVMMTIGAIRTPHYGKSELMQRLSFAIGGPIIAITGCAIIMWATSSSPDGFTWS